MNQRMVKLEAEEEAWPRGPGRGLSTECRRWGARLLHALRAQSQEASPRWPDGFSCADRARRARAGPHAHHSPSNRLSREDGVVSASAICESEAWIKGPKRAERGHAPAESLESDAARWNRSGSSSSKRVDRHEVGEDRVGMRGPVGRRAGPGPCDQGAAGQAYRTDHSSRRTIRGASGLPWSAPISANGACEAGRAVTRMQGGSPREGFDIPGEESPSSTLAGSPTPARGSRGRRRRPWAPPPVGNSGIGTTRRQASLPALSPARPPLRNGPAGRRSVPGRAPASQSVDAPESGLPPTSTRHGPRIDRLIGEGECLRARSQPGEAPSNATARSEQKNPRTGVWRR